MGNAHFPSVAATVAFIQQPFGMIQSMEQQHVYVSAIKQRQQAVFKLDGAPSRFFVWGLGTRLMLCCVSDSRSTAYTHLLNGYYCLVHIHC